ncbi:MAG: hypothetical protein IJ849_06855 [Selenomonadaceae bacterium]|nr:hypothetical protein [Selenomonadaceae bacterium]
MFGGNILTIHENDVETAKETYEIVGSDPFARYLALTHVFEDKMEACMHEEFGDKYQVYRSVEQALEMLDSVGYERSGENIKISEAIERQEEGDDGLINTINYYIYTIPCLAHYQKTDGSLLTERANVSGLIRIVEDVEEGVLPYFMSNTSLQGTIRAERTIREGLDDEKKDGSLTAMVNGWVNIIIGDESVCRSPAEKTFMKAMGEVMNTADHPTIMFPHLYKGEITPIFVLEELEVLDNCLVQGVRRLRQKRGGKPRLTEAQIKKCLARFNHEGSDEWFERIMNDPGAFPRGRKA